MLCSSAQQTLIASFCAAAWDMHSTSIDFASHCSDLIAPGAVLCCPARYLLYRVLLCACRPTLSS